MAIGPVKANIRWEEDRIRFSVCTLVTCPTHYAEMVASFRAAGFQEPECEFLYLDNSDENVYGAYSGYNLFLNVSRGKYIILCHQDIALIDDRNSLEIVLANLSQIDSNWAACGNAGRDSWGRLVLRISDPHGTNRKIGTFPFKVQTLDENLVIVRRRANLALSRDLEGYHLYGTDLCIIADVLGWNCYVVDFHVRHKSGGAIDESFFETRNHLVQKYQRALRSRWIAAPCTSLFVSGIPILGKLLSRMIVIRSAGFVLRFLASLKRFVLRS